ncbi:MAG: hypothetical protein ACRCSP_07955, partial [Rhodoglobus sp.]
ALRALMTIRNTHAAFSGVFDFNQQDAGLITLSWTNGDEYARLEVDAVSRMSVLEWSSTEGPRSAPLLDLL